MKKNQTHTSLSKFKTILARKMSFSLLLLGFFEGISTAQADVISLKSRYTVGDYKTATFSFWHMTVLDPLDKTRNDWEIIFEARKDFDDYFAVNTVGDDDSYIYDLGQGSCEDVTMDTLRSLASKNPGKYRTALVKTGHCYLVDNADIRGNIVSVFFVRDHIKNEEVFLDETRVLYYEHAEDSNHENVSATLKSRYTIGNYVTATFSFWHMTVLDPLNKTLNDWELLFEGREDFVDDFFDVNIGVDNYSYIYDLGKRSCEDVNMDTYNSVSSQNKNNSYKHRYSRYKYRYRYGTTPVRVGHCYLVDNTDSQGNIVSVFSVGDHIKNKKVLLNEIRVLRMERF